MFLPKKNVKKIENVDSSSLFSLKALIDRKKKTKNDPRKMKKKRKIRNPGIEKRNARDLEFRDEERKRMKRSKKSLEKKAEKYNQMISGNTKNESLDSSYLVDFEKKKKKKKKSSDVHEIEGKILIKDEFGRDRWVKQGSEVHRSVLQYMEEHEHSRLYNDEDSYRGMTKRIDGGVKSQVDNVLSEAEKQELDQVREETKIGRELFRQKQKRRDEIMNRLEQQTDMGTKVNKKKALELVQRMLKKSQHPRNEVTTSRSTVTDEERSQILLSEIFQ